MADRIFVMNAGRIEQIGTPSDIYDAPSSPFVADFIGVMNFLPVEVVGESRIKCGEQTMACHTGDYAVGQALSVAVRPEDILLGDAANAQPNRVPAVVQHVESLGSFVRVYLEAQSLAHDEIRADIRKDLARELELTTSSAVTIALPSSSLRLYERGDRV